MTKRLDKEPLRPSEVVSVMREGQQYTQKDLLIKLSRGIDTIRKVLGEMVRAGTIEVEVVGNSKRYSLPVEEAYEGPVVPGSYIPEFREMKPYDIKTHMRQCEAARNKETEMV